MLRLVSLLVVIAVMALMWLAMADGVTPSDDCIEPTVTTISVPKGLESLVKFCE